MIFKDILSFKTIYPVPDRCKAPISITRFKNQVMSVLTAS